MCCNSLELQTNHCRVPDLHVVQGVLLQLRGRYALRLSSVTLLTASNCCPSPSRL
jgi:hypothetical protein